jgi:uncharacterized membrane protein YhiD involved in acid resistance
VIWFVTILGLAFGSGHFYLGLTGWVISLVTLTGLLRIETLVKNDWYGHISVHATIEGISEDEIRRRLEHHLGLHVKGVSLDYDLKNHKRRMRFDVKYKKNDLLELSKRVIEDLRNGSGIEEVKWE